MPRASSGALKAGTRTTSLVATAAEGTSGWPGPASASQATWGTSCPRPESSVRSALDRGLDAPDMR